MFSSQFQELFPGPYSIANWRDGTEECVGVVCDATGQTVAANYYWHQELISEIDSFGVAYELNALHHPDRLLTADESRPAVFAAINQGPFLMQRIDCMLGDFSIECQSNGRSVAIVATDELVATHIAEALNALDLVQLRLPIYPSTAA